jgi:periplasmic protein TonB
MFADSLLETSWSHHGRRGWTILTSFGLQAVIIGFLLLIPILTTVGLPSSRTVSTPVGFFRRDPGPAPHPSAGRTPAVQIVPVTGRIMAPSRIPGVITRDDGPIALPTGPVGIYTGPSIGAGSELPLPTYGTRVVPSIPPPTAKREFKTSSMLEGSLIRRVQPVYPPLARSSRIQGPVILAAVIGRDGTMENLRLISGHPMLVQAAVQAVSQWRYRPYILNGEPIEVETQITVNFILGGN